MRSTCKTKKNPNNKQANKQASKQQNLPDAQQQQQQTNKQTSKRRNKQTNNKKRSNGAYPVVDGRVLVQILEVVLLLGEGIGTLEGGD
jgi:hypothetical protein